MIRIGLGPLRALAVVMVALLLTTAPPLSAQMGSSAAGLATSTNTAIASHHTTDSDFSSASTLDNLTVDGSGTAASVTLPRTTSIVYEDFEGDLSDYTGDTSEYDTVNTPVKNGGQALAAGTGTGGGAHAIFSDTLADTPQAGDNFTVWVYRNNSASGGQQFFFAVDAANTTKRYELDISITNDETSLQKDDSDRDTISSAPSAGSWESVDIHWNEDGSITADVSWSATNLTMMDTEYKSGEIGFRVGMAGTDDNGVDGYFDFVNGDRPLDPPAEYVGADHAVDGATGAFVNITELGNATATVTWETNAGTVLAQQTYSAAGNKTLTWSPTDATIHANVTVNQDGNGEASFSMSEEGVLFSNSAPEVNASSASPSDNQTLNTSSTTLEIDASDENFADSQGESLSVEFFIKQPNESSFSSVGTDTLAANGTASTSFDAVVGGTHEWYAVANDDYGGSTTSSTFAFRAPDRLEIWNESSPDSLVTDATVEVTFVGADKIITQNTTNGTIDLAGVTVSSPMVVEAEADGYFKRTIRVESLYSQTDIYLLPDVAPVESVNVRFKLDDRTGRYPSDETLIRVKKPVTKNGTTKFRTIGADTAGVNGYALNLERGARYQIMVTNTETNRSRVLGRYDAPTSETVTLAIETADIPIEQTDQDWAWNVTKDGSDIKIKYNDTQEETSELRVTIHERGNESNEILSTTVDGPLGQTQITQPLTAAQNNTTWVVDLEADRDGETVRGKRLVGHTRDIGIPIDPFWLQVAGSFTIFLMPSLFPGQRAPMGAIFAGLVGLVLWWLQLLPPEFTATALVGGVLVAYLWRIRDRGRTVQ